jgi:hypothetical protein
VDRSFQLEKLAEVFGGGFFILHWHGPGSGGGNARFIRKRHSKFCACWAGNNPDWRQLQALFLKRYYPHKNNTLHRAHELRTGPWIGFSRAFGGP